MRIARIFGIAFITGFSGAMMPGPMLALVIGQTGAQGMGAVWAIVGGHAALEVVTVALLVIGVRRVLQLPRVRGIIGLVGGAALVYMGADMVRSAGGVALQMGADAEGIPWLKLALAGAAVCIANPYFVGWWATVGTGQLAHTAPRTVAEYLSFFVGHEMADVTWYAAVGLIVVTGAGWLSPAIYTGLIVVCGMAVLLLGLWFIWTGIRFTWLGAGNENTRTAPAGAITSVRE
ncbi:MAG: LysE family transporter [Armatimonadetes bacterium]|nr:LysE family transporter [Armatimonadota bacterium]